MRTSLNFHKHSPTHQKLNSIPMKLLSLLWVGMLVVAMALPSEVIAQTPFTCGSDGNGQVCYEAPSIQYGIFGVHEGEQVGVFGKTRDEACLRWAAKVPNPSRGKYLGVRPYPSSALIHCWFEFKFPGDDRIFSGIDGDNRELRVCPINSVMVNPSGQFDLQNYAKTGAVFMAPPAPMNTMPFYKAGYPTHVFTVDLTDAQYPYRVCATRGAPLPTRNLGESCPRKGNPINLGVEVKTQREIDYQYSGALRFIRTYNSGVGTTYFNGALGAGWQHNWAMRVSASTNAASVWRGDGHIFTFALVNGQWVSWPDLNDKLTELKDALGARSGWRYFSASSGDTEIFDKEGNLISVANKQGHTLTLAYSDGSTTPPNGGTLEGSGQAIPRSLLLRVTDQFGSTLTFGYDALSRIVRVTRPDGLTVRYTYSANGNLSSALYPGTNSAGASVTYERSYLYENISFPHALTGVVAESGQRLSTYIYDSVGRALSTEHAGGVNRYSLSLDSANTTTVTDPLGAKQTYTFDYTFGGVRVLSQSQPAGAGCGPASSSISYDAQANVSSRTDFNNIKTCYSYDLSRNLETRRIEGLPGAAVCAASFSNPPADARFITTQWHTDWHLETRRAEPGLITTSVYNGQGASCAPADALVDGKPIAVVCRRTEQATMDETGAAGFGASPSGAARTTSFTYNRWGQVLTSNGPRGDASDTLTYSYYPDTQANWTQGDLRQISNGLGHVTRFTRYNRHGQVLERVEPNGLVTQYSYDLRQRLTRVQAGDEVSTYAYDAVGNLTQATLPEGGSITYTYDPAHRLIAIQDPQGNRIDYTLDAMGNRIGEKTTDAAGVLRGNVTRTMDALNRVQKVVGGE